MTKKRILTGLSIALILAIASLLFLAACAKQAPAPSPSAAKPAPAPAPKPTTAPDARAGWPKEITIGATSVGSAGYPIYAGWSELIKKYVGVSATPEPTAGSGANINLITTGKMEMGHNSPDVAFEAFRGTGMWKEGKKPIRLVMAAHLGVLQVITRADSGIKTLAGLKGHTYAYYQVGAPLMYAMGDAMLECLGIAKDVTPIKIAGSEDGLKMLLAKQADACQSTAYKAAPLVEAARTYDLVFLPFDKELQACIQKKQPYFINTVIEKGVYKGVNEDIPTMGSRSWAVGHKDLPESFVYETIKALYDHLDEFAKFTPKSKEFDIKHMTESPPAAYHRGAIRFLKEKGLWTPQLEELQKKMLAEVGEAY